MNVGDVKGNDGILFEIAENPGLLGSGLVGRRLVPFDEPDEGAQDQDSAGEDDEALAFHDRPQCRRRRHTRMPAAMAAPGMTMRIRNRINCI